MYVIMGGCVLYLYVCVFVLVCVHACMLCIRESVIDAYVCMCMCIRVCIVYVYGCVYVCILVFMCGCTCICMCFSYTRDWSHVCRRPGSDPD